MLSTDSHLWRTYDPDAWRENPVEIKHRKLLRSQRLGDEGRDLKPGPADRDRLNEIFKLPPTASLNPADKDLLWKFRFSLFRSPRSLTKFLKCVTWSDPVEAKQAVEKLLPLWGQEIGVDDALELLGPGFTDRRVRAFAVRRLERADDEVSAARRLTCRARARARLNQSGASAVPLAAGASPSVRLRFVVPNHPDAVASPERHVERGRR
jgi:phosphatidylinositol 3-kinase